MAPLFKKSLVVNIAIKILFVALAVFLIFQDTAAENNGVKENVEKDQSEQLHNQVAPLTLKVILQEHYLDGNISEQIVEETIWSMEDFWAQYSDWQLVDQTEGQITFKKNIDDISPFLKANGYFGITDDGILSIFKGVPGESEEVIQSFFQIDVSKLESSKQEELKKGIPVVSKEHYIQVIESFKTLSVKQ